MSAQFAGEIDPRFAERERQPGLDLLRAIAIVIVVFYHAGLFGFTLPGNVHRFGWVGVDLFFVLSGYLIGGQLLAQIARSGSISLGRFFARRALRIMPAYFVVLAIYFSVPALREYPEISPLWKFLLSVQNIGMRGGTAFSHAWSLAIEDQFYLALPFLLLPVRGRARTATVVSFAFIIGGIALRLYLAKANLTPTGVSFRAFQKLIYYATWTRLDPLVCGVGVAAIQRFWPKLWSRLASVGWWIWLPAIALISIALWLGESDQLTVTACVWQFPLIAIGMTGLLLWALDPHSLIAPVRIPSAAFFATVAYSVYLSHKLVIHFAIGLCSNWNLPLTTFTAHLLVQAMIYTAGTVLFLAIERPFLQLRKRLAPRASAAA
ncbi:MAG: acyltransferase family protein [Chthoniobacterales bacterium]